MRIYIKPMIHVHTIRVNIMQGSPDTVPVQFNTDVDTQWKDTTNTPIHFEL